MHSRNNQESLRWNGREMIMRKISDSTNSLIVWLMTLQAMTRYVADDHWRYCYYHHHHRHRHRHSQQQNQQHQRKYQHWVHCFNGLYQQTSQKWIIRNTLELIGCWLKCLVYLIRRHWYHSWQLNAWIMLKRIEMHLIVDLFLWLIF